MTDSQQIQSFSDVLSQVAERMEQEIDTRLKAELPQAVTANGEIDMSLVRKSDISRSTGQLVLARAVPGVMDAYAIHTRQLEAEGKTIAATDVFELSGKVRANSLKVLGYARDRLFDEKLLDDELQVFVPAEKRKDGDLLATGEILSDYAEALTIRIQSENMDSFEVESFNQLVVLPSTQLVRLGVTPQNALILADLMVASVGNVSVLDIMELAHETKLNLNDEFELNRLVKFAEDAEYDLNFIRLNSKSLHDIDPETYEAASSKSLTAAELESEANRLLGESPIDVSEDNEESIEDWFEAETNVELQALYQSEVESGEDETDLQDEEDEEEDAATWI